MYDDVAFEDEELTAEERLRRRVCEAKVPYATREEAEAAAVYARWLHGDDGGGVAPYICRFCNRWHLARSG